MKLTDEIIESIGWEKSGDRWIFVVNTNCIFVLDSYDMTEDENYFVCLASGNNISGKRVRTVKELFIECNRISIQLGKEIKIEEFKTIINIE
mgnify:CR=1 FL=1